MGKYFAIVITVVVVIIVIHFYLFIDIRIYIEILDSVYTDLGFVQHYWESQNSILVCSYQGHQEHQCMFLKFSGSAHYFL